MGNAKTTRVFKNGNSLAVRIPSEFSVTEDEMLIQKIGDAILLTPKKDVWESFARSLEEFSPDFMNGGRNQPDLQERKIVFDCAE
ncbi:MAG: type II toxin-antitoxin system VapB family antitoxin [Synergistaceae bacterium]|jgi:antitoxin VapB|nr:type II toxin-antitoxin system VapB family antitoxin [Synergistaceae bacterium]